jgi:hypothetical protein
MKKRAKKDSREGTSGHHIAMIIFVMAIALGLTYLRTRKQQAKEK